MSNNTQSSPKLHHGTCHCGAVQFEATVALDQVTRCNCSICTKTAWLGAILKPDAFRLIKGEADLGSYEWGHKVSRRHFCKHCGVQVFGKGELAELGGAFVSINVNTVDGLEVHDLPVMWWDGRHDNWQAGPTPAARKMFATA